MKGIWMSKLIHVLQLNATTIGIALVVVISGCGLSQSAQAKEDESTSNTQSSQDQSSKREELQDKLRQQREALDAKKQEMKSAKEAAEKQIKAKHEAQQEKLSASKLEICKNRESNITARIARIDDRIVNQLTLFTTISDRAQTFYTDKGITIEDYDQLVATVNERKLTAETAVATMNSLKDTFNCEGDDPKAKIEEVKVGLQSAVTALKDYRIAIKDMITAIKSANSVSSSSTGETE